MTKPYRISPPAELPVDLQVVKSHLRIDFADDDIILSAYISAAISLMDGYSGILGRCLVSQVWGADYQSWGCLRELPFSDVQSVVLKYSDADGNVQTLPPDQYSLVSNERVSMVVYNEGFSAPGLDPDNLHPVTAEMTCGFGSASNVPEPLKVAIMFLVADWYSNREPVGSGSELPLAFGSLVAPYRRTMIG